MTYPHQHSISSVTDPYAVRPGTSAALTARTIDATIHPPLVRAQEAVAAFIPRVAAPLASAGSPVLLGMLGATLVLLVVAHRVRFRPSGLIVAAVLMMMLTSFHPLDAAQTPQVGNDQTSEEIVPWTPTNTDQTPPQISEQPAPLVIEIPEPSDYPDIRPDAIHIEVPETPMVPDATEFPREMRRALMPAAQMMMIEREQLRASMERLRRELRDEARQRKIARSMERAAWSAHRKLLEYSR